MDLQFGYRKSGILFLFLTILSILCGAVLLIRLGYALGVVGYLGVLLAIFVAHLVIFPSALALSEVATNMRVEGRGNEHYMLSRSYGNNIGSVIAFSLFFSYSISVAFYIICFGQAFSPLFEYLEWNSMVFRRLIGVSAVVILSYFLAGRNKKSGYFFAGMNSVLVLLIIVLIMIASPIPGRNTSETLLTFRKGNIMESFFTIFTALFPAFATMIVVISQSRQLTPPGRRVPFLTITVTVIGFLVFSIVAARLFLGIPSEVLNENWFALSVFIKQGDMLVPLVLAVTTLFSAGIFLRIAADLLQSLGNEKAMPIKGLNSYVANSQGKRRSNNALVITTLISLIFVVQGDLNYVSQLLSQLFLITFGMICLFSFLYRFAADPLYSPTFHSRWYISLIGFLAAAWLLVKIEFTFILIALVVIIIIYFSIKRSIQGGNDITNIVYGALTQLSRNILVFMQRKKIEDPSMLWRPSVIGVSSYTYSQGKILEVMNWISRRTGFGTYIHVEISPDHYNIGQQDNSERKRLVNAAGYKNNLLLYPLLASSLSQAVAEVIHFPGFTGGPNNVLMLEYDKSTGNGIKAIQESMSSVRSSSMGLLIYASSGKNTATGEGIHIWLHPEDERASYIQLLFGNIIAEHPTWKNTKYEVFVFSSRQPDHSSAKDKIDDIFGNLPVSPYKVHYVGGDYSDRNTELVSRQSKSAGLIILNLREDEILHNAEIFKAYDELGDILFVNASRLKEFN